MASASWRLRRNCSLTPRQALAAWSVPVGALVLVGVVAAAQAWWWIVAFVAADLAGVAAALYCYARHALDGDTLTFDAERGLLLIEQQRGSRCMHTAWPASLVRIEAAEGRAIRLSAGPRRLQVGGLAQPAQCRRAAAELRLALGLNRWTDAGRLASR